MEKTVVQNRRKRFVALLVSLVMLSSLVPLPEKLGGMAYGSANNVEGRCFFDTDTYQLIIPATDNGGNPIGEYCYPYSRENGVNNVWGSYDNLVRPDEDDVPKVYEVGYRLNGESGSVNTYVLKAPTAINNLVYTGGHTEILKTLLITQLLLTTH